MLKVVTSPTETPEALDLGSTVVLLGAETDETTNVQELIKDATRLAEIVAGRRLWYREYEELIRGTAHVKMYLQARPISSVSNVSLGLADPLVAGSDADQFSLWDRFLYREATWPTDSPGWKVQYFGGYWLPSMAGAAPATAASIDIEGRHVRRAVLEIVKLSWELDGADRTLKSERTPGELGMLREYQRLDNLWIPHGAMETLRSVGPRVP